MQAHCVSDRINLHNLTRVMTALYRNSRNKLLLHVFCSTLVKSQHVSRFCWFENVTITRYTTAEETTGLLIVKTVDRKQADTQ